MSGGVWHPEGCRCSGCQQPAVCQPAPRRVAGEPMPSMKSGDYGIIGPAFLIFFAVALVGFWPAMVWHGQTDTGGWRWDIHSTIAEAVYWGTIGFIALLCWLGNRPTQHTVRTPHGRSDA